MARQVIKTATEPQEVKIGEDSVFICMCGLSKTQPFCDYSHDNTKGEKENIVYIYDEDFERTEVFELGDEDNEGCCGGGCCSNISSTSTTSKDKSKKDSDQDEGEVTVNEIDKKD